MKPSDPNSPPKSNSRSPSKPPNRASRRRWTRRILGAVAVLIALGLLVWALAPSPVEVESAKIGSARLRATVQEDGFTRVHERYQISAPQAGQLERIQLRAGDPVQASEVVAMLSPLSPTLLDPRSRDEAIAALGAAKATLSQVQTTVDQAKAAHRLALAERQRQESLNRQSATTARELDEARALEAQRKAELDSARFAVDAAEKEVERARAVLEQYSQQTQLKLGLRQGLDEVEDLLKAGDSATGDSKQTGDSTQARNSTQARDSETAGESKSTKDSASTAGSTGRGQKSKAIAQSNPSHGGGNAEAAGDADPTQTKSGASDADIAPSASESASSRLGIHTPVSGTVLKVHRESAGAVSLGEVLIEVGDLSSLEVVVDLLTTQAMEVKPGAQVELLHFNAQQGSTSERPRALYGRVRLIEPGAFTKTSALGVDEQRVNVIIDFDDPANLPQLGDGYRMEARILLWEAADVLQVPIGAVFRQQQEWAVFVIKDGRAKLRKVELGRKGDSAWEVLSGLQAQERVVLFPSDELEDGQRVKTDAKGSGV